MTTDLFPGDAKRAAPWRGKTLKIVTVDLNAPLPPELTDPAIVPETGFAIHPAFGVRAIDKKGRPVADGTLVFICRKSPTS